MADQATADAQAAPASQSPADPPDALAESGDETISLEEARKLRREAAALRKREKDLLAEVTTYRTQGLSELERTQRELADLRAAHTAAQAELAAAAQERKAHAVERLLAGAQYPDLLLSRVDLETVELDADGGVRAGDRLVRRLRDAYPALWTAGSGDGGATGGTSATVDMNAWIRNAAGRR